MARSLTDTLCTKCGLCCDGSLFADVELASQAEAARVEILGLEVDEDDREVGLLSQPCPALLGRRCGIYAHRPDCCRAFECHLLQAAQRGDVTIERALAQVAATRQQTQHIRSLLARLGNRDDGLPLKERCAETLAGEGGTIPERQARADLEAAMAALERTISITFLGSGRSRVGRDPGRSAEPAGS